MSWKRTITKRILKINVKTINYIISEMWKKKSNSLTEGRSTFVFIRYPV